MEKTEKLRNILADLYKNRKDLLFHGWHHIIFVEKKALEFAGSIGADLFSVRSAALVHDLNYFIEPDSTPSAGRELRKKILSEAGYSDSEIKRIEAIIEEEHTATRTELISKEDAALSDADTLFKALPITPIIFASRFIEENKIDIERLSQSINKDQAKLMESGIYFYTDLAKERYLKWAKINLDLWDSVGEALQDEDVRELISNYRQNG